MKNLRTRRPRGFTLIEIGIVLFVVVMLMGLALPTLRTVTGIQARTEVSKLASNIRAARGHAAVAGETCRLQFDIDGNSYELLCSTGTVTVEKEESRSGQKDDPEKNDDRELTKEQKAAKDALKAKRNFQPSKSLPTQHLKGNIKFVSVWTPHQEETYTKGKASLYFFPSGASETANIVLQFGDDFYTVQVANLAGNIRIIGDKAELPDQDEGD